MRQRPFFFGLHLNLGPKFRTEIKLLCLTKLCKKISLPRNLLNQRKIDAYAHHSIYDSCKKYEVKAKPEIISSQPPKMNKSDRKWIKCNSRMRNDRPKELQTHRPFPT